MNKAVNMNTSNKTEWTPEKLRKLKKNEIEALFKTLSVPTVSEMSGE